MAIGYADESSKDDKLGGDRYYNGLAEFIKQCETPMTISIQGDWGTGKTTALNIIEQELEKYGQCHVLWFRTWQYSKFGLQENMTLALMSNLYSMLEELAKEKGENVQKSKEQFLKGVKEVGITLVDSKWGGKASEKMNALLDTFFNFEKDASVYKQIEMIKANIQHLIDLIIKGEDERLVVFVDDLDRLDPAVAIELLEGIKNFFDCKKCVFVLAIDSGVVYQGVKSKYGAEFGEEKSKKFFDKIIQVPFNLPVNQYDTKKYIRQFISEQEEQKYIEKYENVIVKIMGNNPRSIKRAFNLLSLHELIMGDSLKGADDKLNLFTILLIQMCREELYQRLVSLAKKSFDTIYEEMNTKEYELIREVLDLNVGNDKSDSDEELLEEERWSGFIELLVETAKISSKGDLDDKMGMLEARGDSPDIQDGYIKSLMDSLEKKYDKVCINDSMTNFMTKSGMKKYSFRRNKDKYNIVLYCEKGEELKEPMLEGVVNKSEYNKVQKAVPKNQIGYYWSSDHMTFVDVCESNSELLKQIMNAYELLYS